MPVPVPSPAVGATQISAAIPPLGSIQIDMAMSSPPFRGAGGGGMAPVDRDGEPRAEGRQRQDLMLVAEDRR